MTQYEKKLIILENWLDRLLTNSSFTEKSYRAIKQYIEVFLPELHEKIYS